MFFFFLVGFFSVFSRQNFVLYFYDHFHFLWGAKKEPCVSVSPNSITD